MTLAVIPANANVDIKIAYTRVGHNVKHTQVIGTINILNNWPFPLSTYGVLNGDLCNIRVLSRYT